MSADVQAAAEPGVSPAPSRPRVVIRDDLRLALRVVLPVVALQGVPLGFLWSWLAPPEVVAVLVDQASGRAAVLPLVGQSEHRFDGMAVFVLLGLAAGVLTGAALWLLRQRRGPVVLVAAVLGSLVAAWLAISLGLWLVDWYYPDVAVAQPGEVIRRAPVLESPWVVVAQPFGAAIVYSILVAWNNADDLDRP